MIKLEQVHIDRIINETPNGIILAILKENNATSLTDLIKIRYENPQLDWKEIDERIKEISEEIYNHNHDTHNKKFIYTNPKVYTFEPYDELIKDESFNMTYQEYEALIGQEINLPDLKIVLELNVG